MDPCHYGKREGEEERVRKSICMRRLRFSLFKICTSASIYMQNQNHKTLNLKCKIQPSPGVLQNPFSNLPWLLQLLTWQFLTGAWNASIFLFASLSRSPLCKFHPYIAFICRLCIPQIVPYIDRSPALTQSIFTCFPPIPQGNQLFLFLTLFFWTPFWRHFLYKRNIAVLPKDYVYY